MFSFLADKFSSVFSSLAGNGYISEKNIQEACASVRIALLEADVPVLVFKRWAIDERGYAI
jgi:signal recognition particle subunit SRP54